MRFRVLFIGATLLLSGCKLLPDPNALLLEENTVTVSAIDLAITLSPAYTYVDSGDYSDYFKYSNAPGGTTHNYKKMIFENPTDRSFVLVEKRNCNRCLFKITSSNVPESDGPGSFLVGNKRIFKWYGSISNPATEDQQVTGDRSDIFTGEYNARTYKYGVQQTYLAITVASPTDAPVVKIEDIVKLTEI